MKFSIIEIIGLLIGLILINIFWFDRIEVVAVLVALTLTFGGWWTVKMFSNHYTLQLPFKKKEYRIDHD